MDTWGEDKGGYKGGGSVHTPPQEDFLGNDGKEKWCTKCALQVVGCI